MRINGRGEGVVRGEGGGFLKRPFFQERNGKVGYGTFDFGIGNGPEGA